MALAATLAEDRINKLTQECTYASAAVSPLDGRLDSLILPHVNGRRVEIIVDEMAARYLDEQVVRVLDGTGWHRSQDVRLRNPLRLLPLSPYSPELNPQDHLSDDLREKYSTTLLICGMPWKIHWRQP